jgi:hypothetical protein
MRVFTVYRVDYARGVKVPIGAIKERRLTERGNNFFDLLHFARKTFAESPKDAFRIALGKTKIGMEKEKALGRRIQI